MISKKEVYSYLNPADNKSKLTVKSQSTKDIINQVLNQHKENLKEAKKIAFLFDAGDAYGTCKNIWNFLKYEIPYNVEPSDKQTTKTLSRILYDALNNVGSDCKHYAGFTGAILDSLGYSFKYRFTGYSAYHQYPTHVYCVCDHDNSNIYIDAVISGFDVEKSYKLKIDKNMSLYKLSGVQEDPQIGGFFGNIVNSVKSAVQSVQRTVQKGVDAAGDAARAAAAKIKQGAATIGLAIPRNAFLLLIKFNVHGWATGMQKLTWDQLQWWADIGGNRTDLQNVIKSGAKEKRIFGFSDNQILNIGDASQIGFEPVTITAALASSAPIIAKITSLLETAEKVSNTVEGVTNAVNNTKSAVSSAVEGFKALTGGLPPDQIIFKKEENVSPASNQLSAADIKAPTDSEALKVANALVSKAKTGMNPVIIGVVAAAAIAAIVLIKKK
jgi:hypothetical protein